MTVAAEPPLSLDAVPARMPGVTVEHFDDESLLLDEATGFVCSLNPTAAAVWSLANSKRPIADIAGQIAALTGGDDRTAERDVAHFVAELRRQGFLRLTSDPPGYRGFADRLHELFAALDAAQADWEATLGTATAMRAAADAGRLYAPLAGLRRYAGSVLDLGHGLGAGVLLASLLGYRAHGIEIDAELHARASALAGQLDLPADLRLGSFLPSGFAPRSLPPDDPAWQAYRRDEGAEDALTSRGAQAIDLWLATPIRDSEAVCVALFEAYAGDHAVLATSLGDGPTTLRDKAGREMRYYGSEDDAALARWFGRDDVPEPR